jgi:hypothetical protein
MATFCPKNSRRPRTGAWRQRNGCHGWSLDVLIPPFLGPRKHLPLYDAIVDEIDRRHGDG